MERIHKKMVETNRITITDDKIKTYKGERT